MTLKELQYLIALAETRHFGKAAELCSVTQSTLSLQLRRLEEHLGVELFDRSSQPITPTAMGWQIIPLARMVLMTTDEMCRLAGSSEKNSLRATHLGKTSQTADHLTL